MGEIRFYHFDEDESYDDDDDENVVGFANLIHFRERLLEAGEHLFLPTDRIELIFLAAKSESRQGLLKNQPIVSRDEKFEVRTNTIQFQFSASSLLSPYICEMVE